MPDLEVLKLFSTAQTDASASLDVPFDGQIMGALLDVRVDGADALNDRISAEVSFSSTSGFASNDTRASFIGASASQGFLTSGGGPTGRNAFITFAPHGIPVSAGERIYLHVAAGGTVTSAVTCWMYVLIDGTARTARRRL